MKPIFSIIILVLAGFINQTAAHPRTVHVFVALCDNVHQGIVPVPKSLGDGKDPGNNLYWGAAYGVKSFFRHKSPEWKLVATMNANNPIILERLLFKHATEDVYMLADAYDGEKIKTCIEDFLKASNGQNVDIVTHDSASIRFGGGADLVTYIGHDGLMEFDISITYKATSAKKDAIMLACFSKAYFAEEMRKANANPLLWTTHLMAPEAYVLKAALDGWVRKESGAAIDERAAQAYNTYQKCGIKGARGLFTTGF